MTEAPDVRAEAAPVGADDRRADPPRAWADVGLGWGWIVAGAGVVVALIPLCFMGPGTDLDVRAIVRSGSSIVGEGPYMVSRSPGAPVHEAAAGLLYRLGGTAASNLGSLAAGTALTVLLAFLLRHEGASRVGLSVAVVVTNPWFLIAATSTIDFLWALALWAGAALVLRVRPSLPGAFSAGVLAGLAVGCRASTAFLVGALALAELLERPVRADPTDRLRVRPHARVLLFTGAAAAFGLLVYVPGFRSTDSSLAFAQNDVPTSSFFVQLGRFLAKDLYFVGPFAAVVLLVALPSLVRAVARWRTDFLVRLGLLTVLVSQLLFLRYPWKMGHLLPTLVGLAFLLARALEAKPRLLAAFVAAQALYCFVSISLLAPDTPNRATGGRFVFEPRWGAVVVDTQCRLDDPDAWKGSDEDVILVPGEIDIVAERKLQAVWDCAKPWAR